MNNSWQGCQPLKITFDELEKVDLDEIRELMGEDNTETPLLPDG